MPEPTPERAGPKPPEGALFPSQVLARDVGAVRRLTGWTQALVAERMNNLGHRWTAATVSEVERGYRNVTTDELVNLALVLGRTVERLLDLGSVGPSARSSTRASSPSAQPSGETRVALVNAASEELRRAVQAHGGRVPARPLAPKPARPGPAGHVGRASLQG